MTQLTNKLRPGHESACRQTDRRDGQSDSYSPLLFEGVMTISHFKADVRRLKIKYNLNSFVNSFYCNICITIFCCCTSAFSWGCLKCSTTYSDYFNVVFWFHCLDSVTYSIQKERYIYPRIENINILNKILIDSLFLHTQIYHKYTGLMMKSKIFIADY